MQNVVPPQAGKSTFVTVLAWLSIAMSGFGTVIGLLQSVMVFTLFNGPEMQQATAQAAADPGTPPILAAVTQWGPWLFVVFCLISALTLATSIALLQRRNWARIVFIGLLVLGILWQVVGLAIQQFVFSTMPSPADFQGASPDHTFETMLHVMRAFSIAVAIAMAILFAWFIKKLVSPAIVAEFR